MATNPEQYDSLKRWKNVDPARADDIGRAEHQAYVEDEWRDSVTYHSDLAQNVSKIQIPRSVRRAAGQILAIADEQAAVYGPHAVDLAGREYDNAQNNPDDFHNPVLPPLTGDASVDNPGVRRPLDIPDN